MYCKNCGKPITDGKFCPYCGTKIDYLENENIEDNKEIEKDSIEVNNIETESKTEPVAPSFSSQPVEAERKGDKSGVAIAALIFAIISFFVPLIFIIAIILGCIGLKSRKRGMAKAGIIMGIFSSVINIVLLGIYIPTTLAVVNRGKKQQAIKKVETVFNVARNVLQEASEDHEHYPYVEYWNGTYYQVTTLSLYTEGLIEKLPFDDFAYDGGMTVCYYPSTGDYSCSFTSTMNGYTFTYDGHTFTAQ